MEIQWFPAYILTTKYVPCTQLVMRGFNSHKIAHLLLWYGTNSETSLHKSPPPNVREISSVTSGVLLDQLVGAIIH